MLIDNKVPAVDGIPTEPLKPMSGGMTTKLHEVINTIWSEETMAEDFGESVICSIYKKGDKLWFENY